MPPGATKAERDRWRWFQEIGCIVCLLNGHRGTPGDVHHLTSGGRRLGHRFTVCLCPAHHRGGTRVTSLAHGRKAFEHAHGYTEDQLLELQDHAIVRARLEAGFDEEIEGLDPPLQRAA